MKYLSAATAVALMGFAPVIGAECGHDASSASATPPSQLVSAPAPEASRAPTSMAKTAPATKKAAKQVADRSKEPATDTKVAAVSIK